MPTWKFRKISRDVAMPRGARNIAILQEDRWNDYGFGTMFHLYVLNSHGDLVEIGTVKIGQMGMALDPLDPRSRTRFTPLPTTFRALDSSYFSVGQDRSYYEALIAVVGVSDANLILGALQDLALNVDRLDDVLSEEVAEASLFRQVSPSSVRDQFRRILLGGESKDEFALTYHLEDDPTQTMRFAVTPDSYPPTNVHVLIGPNGSGKTRTLRRLRLAFDDREEFDSESNYLRLSDWSQITSLVSVSFSAFDPFPPAVRPALSEADFRFFHIGLRTESSDGSSDSQIMGPDQLSEAFRKSFEACSALAERRKRLEAVLAFMESDPVLGKLDISDSRGLLARLNFSSRSSGHKIVLLTLVRLVELVEEKTLVLVDEPEAHLHPPLLAAFTRALSWLMADRNGLAVLATHSPVVLQEVPSHCVWVLWSSGEDATATRPPMETFGENLGVLTREVFHYEIEQSGFHRMLRDVADTEPSYESAMRRLGNNLGQEARAILRALISRRGGVV